MWPPPEKSRLWGKGVENGHSVGTQRYIRAGPRCHGKLVSEEQQREVTETSQTSCSAEVQPPAFWEDLSFMMSSNNGCSGRSVKVWNLSFYNRLHLKSRYSPQDHPLCWIFQLVSSLKFDFCILLLMDRCLWDVFNTDFPSSANVKCSHQMREF